VRVCPALLPRWLADAELDHRDAGISTQSAQRRLADVWAEAYRNWPSVLELLTNGVLVLRHVSLECGQSATRCVICDGILKDAASHRRPEQPACPIRLARPRRVCKSPFPWLNIGQVARRTKTPPARRCVEIDPRACLLHCLLERDSHWPRPKLGAGDPGLVSRGAAVCNALIGREVEETDPPPPKLLVIADGGPRRSLQPPSPGCATHLPASLVV
jgi:hypothetical protein